MKRMAFCLLLALPLTVVGQKRVAKMTWERLEITDRFDNQANARLTQVVAPYRAGVDSIMAPVLGQSLVGMSGGRPESLLGNWGADVLVEQSAFDGLPQADLGIINVGGLRNNMPKGTVTQGDVMLISPFQNVLSRVTMKGDDLLSLFRDIAAVGGEGVSHSVRLVINKKGELLSATVGGQEIDPERHYVVATLDYLAEGNDKLYSFKKKMDMKVSKFLARDAMMQSIRQNCTIDAKIEGRITIKD